MPAAHLESMLTFREMQIVSAIFRCGSITGAARMLSVSQPALSRQLRHAEDRLSYPLFSRTCGGVEPTAEGQLLFHEIERSERNLHAIQSLAAELGLGRAGLLRIGASSSLSLTLLPPAVNAFRRACPGVKVIAHSGSFTHIEEMAVSREIDLGFTLSPINAPNASIRQIANTGIVCIMAPDHPLNACRVVRPADIAQYELISYASSSHWGQLLDLAFQKEGQVRRTHVEIWPTLLAPRLVIGSRSVALVDALLASHSTEEISIRPFAPRITLSLNMIAPSSAPASHLAAKFIECMRDAITAAGGGCKSVELLPEFSDPPS